VKAVRSTDFYVDHLTASGSFSLKPAIQNTSYNESLAYTYWLLGDNRMLAPISNVVKPTAVLLADWLTGAMWLHAADRVTRSVTAMSPRPCLDSAAMVQLPSRTG